MNGPIGIMDWGIGGLSVYSLIRKCGYDCDVIYHSDSGSTPYGKMTSHELRQRFAELAVLFKGKGCREVLVACNAASSALHSDQEVIEGVLFHSIIPAGVRAVMESPAKKIGVIGGLRTIDSGVYQQRLPAGRFTFLPAQPLSALVERGELEGESVEEEVRKVLSGLADCDGVLLACTHYPALSPVFRRLRPELALFDPAEVMKEIVLSHKGSSRFEFHTTGDRDTSRRAAVLAFGVSF